MLLIGFVFSTSTAMAEGGGEEEFEFEINNSPPDEPVVAASINESLYPLLASGLLFSFIYFRKRVKAVKGQD